MPLTNNNEERKPTPALRRSPRFLQHVITRVEIPPIPQNSASGNNIWAPDFSGSRRKADRVPKNGARKGRELKALADEHREDSTRLSRLGKEDKANRVGKRGLRTSISEVKFANCSNKVIDESARNGDGKFAEAEVGIKARLRRKSGRFNEGVPLIKAQDSPEKYVIDKRATRNSVRADKSATNQVNDFDPEKGVRILSKEGKAGDRVSGSSLAITGLNGPQELKLNARKRDAHDSGIERETNRKCCKRSVQNGEKGKSSQDGEECGIVQGWSKEQELALQNAYFAAKPTPQFWKKVARMVPGKSAKDCFDRIQSDQLTPSQPQARSRAKKKEPSSPLFSASKLLGPAEMKTKSRPSRRALQAQKTVRQILRKQQDEDHNNEADVFAQLEPTADLTALNFQDCTEFASPEMKQGFSLQASFREMSSPANKKHISRLSSSKGAVFVSPPVLKPVKNKALHEKYIDQLHCRDAKRKSEALRNAKSSWAKNDQNKSPSKQKSVKVAKDALVSEAQHVISQFQILQSSKDIDDIDGGDTSPSNKDYDEEELC